MSRRQLHFWGWQEDSWIGQALYRRHRYSWCTFLLSGPPSFTKFTTSISLGSSLLLIWRPRPMPQYPHFESGSVSGRWPSSIKLFVSRHFYGDRIGSSPLGFGVTLNLTLTAMRWEGTAVNQRTVNHWALYRRRLRLRCLRSTPTRRTRERASERENGRRIDTLRKKHKLTPPTNAATPRAPQTSVVSPLLVGRPVCETGCRQAKATSASSSSQAHCAGAAELLSSLAASVHLLTAAGWPCFAHHWGFARRFPNQVPRPEAAASPPSEILAKVWRCRCEHERNGEEITRLLPFDLPPDYLSDPTRRSRSLRCMCVCVC